MKKLVRKFITAGIALTLTLAAASTAFAGWSQDAKGWKYTFPNGHTAFDGKHWIDGDDDGTAELYAFDSDGYLLTGTTTKDGDDVNADGQVIRDGKVWAISVEKYDGQPKKDSALGVTFNDVEGRMYQLEPNKTDAALGLNTSTRVILTPHGEDSDLKMLVEVHDSSDSTGEALYGNIKRKLEYLGWEERYVRNEIPLEIYTSANGVTWHGGWSNVYYGEAYVCCGAQYNGKDYFVSISDHNFRVDLQYVLSHLEIN